MTSHGEPLEPEDFPSPAAITEELAANLPAVGLFGAATPGVLNPAPFVIVDDVELATGVEDGVLEGLVVVDGLEFTWGREEVLDQPDPSTGTLQLFDPSGTWATSSDLRGKLVTIGYDLDGVRKVNFRGRIGGPVQLSRKTVLLEDDTRVDGALVTLPLVSLLLDLANIRGAGAWPEETVEARRARIAAAASSVVADVVVRDYWLVPKVRPVAATEQVSLLEHLVNLYNSSGADRMVYLPDTNVVSFTQRRDYPSSRGHGRLWWETTTGPRAGKGVFVKATGNAVVYPWLDSAALEYSPEDGITQPERLTRVELVHTSSPSMTERVVTRLVTGQDERRSGVRTIRLESEVTWDNFADTAASDLEDMVQKEGAAWRLEDLVLKTRKVGGFEDATVLAFLLAGAESIDLLFLERSWLPAFGLRPVIGIMGGTIAYRRQGWEVTFTPAPMTSTLPQHAITWEEIDDGTAPYQVQWWDGDHPRGMHESLSLDDLGFVARGMGASPVVGPDTGWDTLQ